MFSTLDSFLQQLQQDLDSLNISLDRLTVDHIAYRSTFQDVEECKKTLDTSGYCIDTAIISWRPILVYILEEPVTFLHQKIEVLEFMYPKEWATKGWWDHIEVVLGDYTPSLVILRDRIEKQYGNILEPKNNQYIVKYAEGKVDWQDPNPAITLQFEKSALRFHTIPLKDLVMKS